MWEACCPPALSRLYNHSEQRNSAVGGTNRKMGSTNSSILSPLFHLDGTRSSVVFVYSLLFVVGVVGNGWVACILLRLLATSTGPNSGRLERTRKSDTTRRQIQLYILSLCVCDLFILAFLPFVIADLVFGEWMVRYSWFCRLYLSTEGLNKFGAPFLLLSLSAFCYLSVNVASNNNRKHAWAQLFTRTSTTVGLLVTCTGLVAVLSSPLYLYGDVHWLVVDNNDHVPYTPMNVTKCGFLPPIDALTVFVIYGFILGYLLPAGAFAFFYFNLVSFVRRQCSVARETRVARLARVSWTSILLVAFYIVCWTPYWAMSLFQYGLWINKGNEIHPDATFEVEKHSPVVIVLSYLVHILPYVNCTGFPILYLYSNNTIKEAYTRLTTRRDRAQPRFQFEMRNM